jgi:hypothetical protein
MRAVPGGAHLTPLRRGSQRSPRPALVLGAGLTVLVGAGVAIALTVPGGTSHETTPRRPTASHSAKAALAANVNVLQECQHAWQALHNVLVVAQPAMQQWHRHIAVMNSFVAGRLTPAQANEIWDQTRERAERLYDTFTSRDHALVQAAGSPDCPDPPRSSPATSPDTSRDASPDASPAGSPVVAGCERAVAAEGRTLDAARTTLTTWHHHIAAMNQLRAGMLDPGMAQQMWIATWHTGDAQLRRYHDRLRRSTALSCTTSRLP